MPKKLTSNPKAVEARERKEAVKKERSSVAAKAADDAKWADEGQSAAERRASEKEQKRLEEVKRKEAKKAATARDEADMKAVRTVRVNPHKVTIAQIQSTFASREKERERDRQEEEARRQRLLTQHDLPTENVNQLERDKRLEEEAQFGRGGVVEARTLDDAIGSLSLSNGAGPDEDRHPEKRLKAAYAEYEEAHWAELKADNPSLRHSQLKELLWRQWQKAPNNPINQAAQREREAAKEKATTAVD